MRTSRQGSNNMHYQQHGNEDLQRPEVTQQPSRQQPRNGNVHSNGDTETASRNREQAYLLLVRSGLVSQVGPQSSHEPTRQERDRIVRRFWATMAATNPPQSLQNGNGPPFYAFPVPGNLLWGASGRRNAISGSSNLPFAGVSGLWAALQRLVEVYLGNNSQNSRRSLAHLIFTILEEAEDSSKNSGRRESGGRRSGPQYQDRSARSDW